MANADGLISALLLVLGLNLVMFLVGGAITDLGGSNELIDDNNLLMNFNAGSNGTYDIPSDPGASLPGGAATSISPDTGNVFTDTFTSIKTWFVDVTGLGWLLGIMQGPKVVLTFMGLPEAAAWALAALWYSLTLFLIVAFFWGR
jgi:hypothetical protein